MRTNCTLTDASFAGNLLSDAAAVALAAALAGNASLTRLDLSRNVIRTIGAQAMRQAMHTNHALVSLGKLDSLPIGVGLRASLEWYLRNNKERRDALGVEAERAATQREGMLNLLPPEERALREQIFKLEDETHRLASENKAHETESAQVGRLLTETVKRNAELVDTVATLQSQVDALRRESAKKKVAKNRGAVRKAARAAAKENPQSQMHTFGSEAGAPSRAPPPKGPKSGTVGSGASGAVAAAATNPQQAQALMGLSPREARKARAAGGGVPAKGGGVGKVLISRREQSAFEESMLQQWDAMADTREPYGEEDGLSDLELELSAPAPAFAPAFAPAPAPAPEESSARLLAVSEQLEGMGDGGAIGGWMGGDLLPRCRL